jgi:hypothetical protein
VYLQSEVLTHATTHSRDRYHTFEMKRYLIILLIIITACNSKSNENTSSKNVSSDQEFSKYQRDSITQMKYLLDLNSALDEPNLTDLEYECYRLTLHKSFENPMIYRIDRKGDDYHKLVVKEYQTDTIDGNPNKALLLNEKTLNITKSEFNEFKNLLNQSYYWTLKFWDERSGLDGDTYVLEALLPWTREKNEKKYHCVMRWSPYQGSFKEACEKLVKFNNENQSN